MLFFFLTFSTILLNVSLYLYLRFLVIKINKDLIFRLIIRGTKCENVIKPEGNQMTGLLCNLLTPRKQNHVGHPRHVRTSKGMRHEGTKGTQGT